MFVGDGSCGEYMCNSGKKSSWAINNLDYDLLLNCKEKLVKIHPDYDFVILDTVDSSGVYKLVAKGNIVDFVRKYRSSCYDGACKIIPSDVFSSTNTMNAFLDGLWASDGCRSDNIKSGCHRIDTKNQLTAQWYYILLRNLGFNVSINTRSDKNSIYRLTWTTYKYRKNPVAVKKIYVLHDSYDGYVYDIETESGSFQAGTGQLIVKNTDSVMVQFDVGNLKGDAAIRRSWELGEQASQRVQKILRSPNELELEKVYCPYFLYSKKRYAAKKWTLESDGSLESSVDVKGLQLVRRDICPFVRGVCKQVLDCILESQDPLPVIQFVRQAKEKLLSGEIPLSELTLTRNLAAEYKSQNLAHVKVRDKIREREPGSEPKSGDRIPFVLVKTDKKEKAAYQKAEDPSWVVDHGLELDYEYYFKNHMKKPVSDLLEPLIDQKDLWGT
jgi:hypothetical protein